MNASKSTEDDHQARSSFARKLIQQPTGNKAFLKPSSRIPKKIIQFWDDLDNLPSDVQECMNSWKITEELGFEILIFDKKKAVSFINENLGQRYSKAFENCYHPAMQSDYFRLCYIFVEGGCYVDADDVYNGNQIQHLFSDVRLKIQPLCYDIATHSMVSSKIFTELGANAESWIFYFNNNPLIAKKGHPIIKLALEKSTFSLERQNLDNLPEIQSTTGPGNLTKSIVDAVKANPKMGHRVFVLCEWDDIASNKWDLSYRNDARNWRHSNCLAYKK